MVGVTSREQGGNDMPPVLSAESTMPHDIRDQLPHDSSTEKIAEYHKSYDELKTALNRLDAVLAMSNSEQAAPEVARLLNQISSIDLPAEVKNREIGRHSTQTQAEVKEAQKTSGTEKVTMAHRAAQEAVYHYMVAERMTSAAAYESYKRAVEEFNNSPLTKESIEKFQRANAADIAAREKEFNAQLDAAQNLPEEEKQQRLEELKKEAEEERKRWEKEKESLLAKMATLDPNSEEYKKLSIQVDALSARIESAEHCAHQAQSAIEQANENVKSSEKSVTTDAEEAITQQGEQRDASLSERVVPVTEDVIAQNATLRINTDALSNAQALAGMSRSDVINNEVLSTNSDMASNSELDDLLASIDAPRDAVPPLHAERMAGAPVPSAPPLQMSGVSSGTVSNTGAIVSAPQPRQVSEPNTPSTTQTIALNGATRVDVDEAEVDNANTNEFNAMLRRQEQHVA